MKIQKTISLSIEEINLLRQAARILEEVSTSGENRCWTPRDIRDLTTVDNKKVLDNSVKVIFE